MQDMQKRQQGTGRTGHRCSNGCCNASDCLQRLSAVQMRLQHPQPLKLAQLATRPEHTAVLHCRATFTSTHVDGCAMQPAWMRSTSPDPIGDDAEGPLFFATGARDSMGPAPPLWSCRHEAAPDEGRRRPALDPNRRSIMHTAAGAQATASGSPDTARPPEAEWHPDWSLDR